MPRFLTLLGLDPDRLLFGNALLDWLYAIVLGLATFLALLALRRILKRRTTETRHAALPGIQLVGSLTRHTLTGPLFAISLMVGLKYLDFGQRVEQLTTAGIVIMFGLQLGLWLTTVVRFYLAAYHRDAANPTAATSVNIFDFGARLVIWTIVALVALSNLGVNISAALTGLGIGGVAVALAAQSFLGDLFASLSIALDKPFMVGDTLVIDSVTGTVESVGVRSTRLRSLSGELVIIANTDLLKARLRNYARLSERRKIFTFRVGYDTPIEKLREIPALVRTVVERERGALFERCHLRHLGEAGPEFETSFISRDGTFLELARLEQAVNLGIIEALAGQAVEISAAALVASPTPRA
jgi:small-conductance mechanosensitive channel